MIHPMLEKVARDMAAARNNTDGDCAWRDELPAARAAVQALLEPDERLLLRAEGYSDFIPPDGTHDNTRAGRMAGLRQAYRAMLLPLIEGEGE